jgi:putative phage-type endonuclease
MGIYVCDAGGAEWLARRKEGIGASDMPNLLGVGFRDPAAVLESKRGPISTASPDGRLLRGIELEPIVARKYEQVTGVDLHHVGMHRHETSPFLLASPDRVRDDYGRIVELKTVSNFDDWGPSGSDEVPIGYRVQANQTMEVMGDWSMDFAVLDVFAWEFRWFRVSVERSIVERIRQAGEEFWDIVQSGAQAVPSDWALRHYLDAPPIPFQGQRVNLADDVGELIEERERIREILAEEDKRVRNMLEQIIDRMGSAEYARAGDWNIRRTLIKGGGGRMDYVKTTFTKAKVKR